MRKLVFTYFDYKDKDMGKLVTIKGQKAFTTSEEIAIGVGNEHRSVRRLIQDHSGTKTLSGVRLQKVPTRGRPKEYYLLDEQQATFLITLMDHSDKITGFKEKLVDEFFKQRKVIAHLIAQRNNPEWKEVRGSGKTVYHQKTDVISQFVDYAYLDGSTSAHRYYANFAKMENTALFFFEQKYPNLREVMTIRQLMLVSTADVIIEKALIEGMDKELPYKECFQLAKKRVVAFVALVGQSPILSLTEKSSTLHQ